MAPDRMPHFLVARASVQEELEGDVLLGGACEEKFLQLIDAVSFDFAGREVRQVAACYQILNTQVFRKDKTTMVLLRTVGAPSPRLGRNCSYSKMLQIIIPHAPICKECSVPDIAREPETRGRRFPTAGLIPRRSACNFSVTGESHARGVEVKEH
jgi:hypothetical protein